MVDRTPQWLRDDPIDLSEDKFDVARLVQGVFDLLRAAKPPLTVSLSGNWGVGKSTVAQGLVDRFNADTSEGGMPACLIDAWTADIADLRRQLVIEAGAALRAERSADDVLWRKRLGAERIDIAKRLDAKLLQATTDEEPIIELNWGGSESLERPRGTRKWLLIVSLGVLLTLLLAWFGGEDTSFARVMAALADASGTLLGALLVFVVLQTGLVARSRSRSVATEPAREFVVLAEEFRRLVAPDLGPEAKKLPSKVVVVVDNLDRLTREDAVKALAEIRSLVESPRSRCLFVIPIDRNAFVGQLGQSLEGKSSARDYLDKFFTVDIQLAPPAVVDLRRLAAERALELWPDTDIGAASEVIAVGSGGSPRLVTRLLNGMATRHYLTEEPRPTLEQLAVIETLASLIPGLSQLVAHDARSVVRLRQWVLRSDNRDRQRELVSHLVRLAFADAERVPRDDDETPTDPAPQARPLSLEADVADLTDRILTFLLQTRNVELGPEEVQHAVLLRSDPIWRGVVDSTALREALREGGNQFAELLRTRSDRTAVLQAAVAQIDHDHSARWDDSALAEVNSLASTVDGDERRLAYRPATEAFVRVDPAEYDRVSPDTWLLLADLSADVGGNARRLSRLVGEVSPHITQGEHARPFVSLATSLAHANLLDGQQRALVNEALGKLDDETVGRVFDPPVPVLMSTLAKRYVDRLKTWETGADVGLAAARLLTMRSANARIESLVTDLVGTLAGRLDELPPDGDPILLSIAELASGGSATSERDSFAAALVRDRGTADVVRAALGLELTPDGTTNVAAVVREWLTGAPAATVRSVVEDSRERLTAMGADYAAIAASRWMTDRDGDLMAVALSDESGYAHLRSQLGNSATTVPLAVLTAEGLAAAHRSGRADECTARAAEIAGLAAPIVRDAAPQYVVETPRLIRALRRLGAERPIVEMAIQRLRNSSTPVELNHVASWAMALDDTDLERELAKDIAAIGATEEIGPVDPGVYSWLANRTGGNNDSRDMIVQLVAVTSLGIDALREAIEPARSALKSHRIVAAALVRRATDFPDESDSEPYLREALQWTGIGSASDARDDLNTLIGRSDDDAFIDLANQVREALDL